MGRSYDSPMDYLAEHGVMRSQDEVIRNSTDEFENYCPDRSEISDHGCLATALLELTNKHIDEENEERKNQKKPLLARLKELKASQVAYLIHFVYFVRMIKCTGINGDSVEDYDVLGIYHFWGEFEGIYVTYIAVLRQIILSFVFSATENFFKEVIAKLRTIAERVERTVNKDLIALKNGIFDYRKKELLPFTPEYVFISKLFIPYNPFAKPVKITKEL